MSTRYAILVENNDGEWEVSEIKQMEGAPPQVPSTHKVVKVPDGVLIGMIKGGKKDAVGGYGFAEDTPGADVRSPSTVNPTEDAATPKAKAKAPKG